MVAGAAVNCREDELPYAVLLTLLSSLLQAIPTQQQDCFRNDRDSLQHQDPTADGIVEQNLLQRELFTPLPDGTSLDIVQAVEPERAAERSRPTDLGVGEPSRGTALLKCGQHCSWDMAQMMVWLRSCNCWPAGGIAQGQSSDRESRSTGRPAGRHLLQACDLTPITSIEAILSRRPAQIIDGFGENSAPFLDPGFVSLRNPILAFGKMGTGELVTIRLVSTLKLVTRGGKAGLCVGMGAGAIIGILAALGVIGENHTGRKLLNDTPPQMSQNLDLLQMLEAREEYLPLFEIASPHNASFNSTLVVKKKGQSVRYAIKAYVRVDPDLQAVNLDVVGIGSDVPHTPFSMRLSNAAFNVHDRTIIWAANSIEALGHVRKFCIVI